MIARYFLTSITDLDSVSVAVCLIKKTILDQSNAQLLESGNRERDHLEPMLHWYIVAPAHTFQHYENLEVVRSDFTSIYLVANKQ